MKQKILGIFIVFITLTACSLGAQLNDDDGGNGDDVDIPIRIQGEVDETEEVELRATNTPIPTATPEADDDEESSITQDFTTVGTSNNTTTTTIICTGVPTGWVTYVIVRGDTLSAIARRTNTTTQILASANCLSDPSQITVGQIISVPMSPIPTNQTVGVVRVDPYQGVEWVYPLPANTAVTFTWSGVPANIQSATFTYYGDDGTTLNIGTDPTIANGASITWTTPTNFNGRVIASGQVIGQTNVYRQSHEIRIYRGQPQTSLGEVAVSPYIRIQDGMYILDISQNITLSWSQAPRDALMVEFSIQIASAANPNEWTLIGTDWNLADGVSIITTFTPRMGGEVQAVAHYSDGSTVTTARRIVVAPDPNTQPTVVTSGDIQISDYDRIDNGVYILRVGQTITLTWSPPAFPNQNFGPADYILRSDDGSTMAIGTDADFDSVILFNWTVPSGVSGDLFASARLPGQSHNGVQSNWVRIRSEEPASSTVTMDAAYQAFEGGHMIWRSDTREILVFYSDNQTFSTVSASAYEGMPDNPITETPPEGRVLPVRGFGRLWGNFEAVRERLGWGFSDEVGYTLSVTSVDFGTIRARYSLPDGREFVVYDDTTWEFE